MIKFTILPRRLPSMTHDEFDLHACEFVLTTETTFLG